ncbi:uncharacterized protein BJX67DRAFT_386302 [Aspergillus lucknowensis]|uniref:GST N-terminal domain-containing protein n=1 Tax=Aspergillus lucknowensis TaxID=176173 RepID=A0ABR4L8E5_9EURO
MAESTRLHFFDILSELPGPTKAWSPNTLKTRIALNFKGIPYTQTYVSYPDIEPILRSLSVAPHPEGSLLRYTLPAIVHPSVKSNPSGALMDSLPIARHLEEHFPNTPTLFPSGNASYALAVAVNKIMSAAGRAGYTYLIPKIREILDPRAQEYYTRTRTSPGFFGKPLEEVSPQTEKELRDIVTNMKKELVPVVEMLKGKAGKTGPFFEGETPGYADLIYVAFMIWFKVADDKLWEELFGVGDGELKALWDAVYPWVEGQGEDKEWKVPQ